jgi:hypothetical protein
VAGLKKEMLLACQDNVSERRITVLRIRSTKAKGVHDKEKKNQYEAAEEKAKQTAS